MGKKVIRVENLDGETISKIVMCGECLRVLGDPQEQKILLSLVRKFLQGLSSGLLFAIKHIVNCEQCWSECGEIKDNTKGLEEETILRELGCEEALRILKNPREQETSEQLLNALKHVLDCKQSLCWLELRVILKAMFNIDIGEKF